jgi:hypothetical protein
MSTIQFRRRLIVVLLLCTAAIAALVRHQAAPGSTVHDVSTVLMLLWLPVLGSILGWVYGKLLRKPPPPPEGFAPGQAFQPQALVTFTLRPAAIPAEDIPVQAGEHRCVLVVGNQGFQMRWQMPSGETFRRGEPREAAVEFLAPHKALPLLPQGTAFRMMVGEAFVGDGRVLQQLPGA